MNVIVSAALSLLGGFFKGTGVSQAAGTSNGLLFYSTLIGGGAWILSGHAESWTITLNARELLGLVLLGSLGLEFFRKMNPPSP